MQIRPREARRALVALLAVGLLVRLVWTTTTPGNAFDMASLQMLAQALGHHPLHVYSTLNPPGLFRWPYPPGYMPWVLAADWLHVHAGVPFRVVVAIPTLLADCAIALLVWFGLGRAGASPAARLAGAAAVALGPSFAVISGYHGQIDAVAIAPAVAAVLVWEAGGRRRAVTAGALVGIAICIKTAPALTVLALLPTVRSRREAVSLLAASAAIPLLALAPFVLADPTGVLRALRYMGIPGLGGLGLFVQPSLARMTIASPVGFHASSASILLAHWGGLVTLAGALGVAVMAARRRTGPREAAAMIWLAFLVFDTSFSFQYVIWVLPFVLLTGRVRTAVGVQVALLAPMAIYYLGPWNGGADWPVFVWAFVALMWFAWGTWLAAFVTQLRGGGTLAGNPRATARGDHVAPASPSPVLSAS